MVSRRGAEAGFKFYPGKVAQTPLSVSAHAWSVSDTRFLRRIF